MTKKMQQNLIMVALVFFGTIFVYYKYLYSPLVNKYKEMYTKVEQTEKRLNEIKRRALELPRLQAEMKQLEMEVALLEKRLPKDKEIPELLRTLTKTAQRYQLKVISISPGGVTPQANYNEVPFQITLQGTYHAFACFLSELGQESRILSERNLSMTANAGTKESPATINANFTLIAYTFKG